ncbi:MAG: DUF4105 domain-containing protein [Myxococcota bacterium]
MIGRLLATPVVLLALSWACAAIAIDGAGPPAAAAFGVAALAVLLAVRPFGRGLGAAFALFLGVLVWWRMLEPSNDRAWLADVARLPEATIDGDVVTIRNVRNFDYRSETDYDERWEERRYDLSKLVGTDIFLSYWGSPWIAHTIMSWAFEDGRHLAISIETRKEQGEEYSALLGFFRQYELYYVVADELDLVRLRTNFRGEDVYLYRFDAPVETGRAVLLDYLRVIDELAREPRWYNALTHNCTTTIRHHVQHVGAGNPWDWRILVNGRLDELGHARGTIDASLPFEELRRISAISERGKAAPVERFSAAIREGLPGMDARGR